MIILTSGCFDPLHVGHLECLELAKALGDKLIVIVNNDNQIKLKKGKSFMSEQDRLKILNSIKVVDEVFLSIDQDASVCKSIEAVASREKVDIFAKGGDRHEGEIPEKKICNKLGIKIVDGLGEKIRSSSELIESSNGEDVS